MGSMVFEVCNSENSFVGKFKFARSPWKIAFLDFNGSKYYKVSYENANFYTKISFYFGYPS